MSDVESAGVTPRTGPHGSGSRAALFLRRHAHAAGAVAVFVMSLVGSLGDLTTRYVSLWDEGFHLSYVQYMTEGHIPRLGEVMSVWARDAYACHELFPNGYVSSTTCKGDYNPGLFPDGGANSAAAWPPLYYAAAGMMVRLMLITGVEPLYLARAATAVIWALGLAILTLAAMKVAGSALRGTAVGVALAALPIAAYLGAFVGPHSTQPLVTGVSVLAWLWLFESASRKQVLTRSAIWLATVVVVVLTIPHALSLVGALAVAAAIRMVGGDRKDRVAGLAVMLSVALGLLTFRGWGVLQEYRTVPLDERINPDTFIQVGEDPYSPVFTTLTHWWDFWPLNLFDYPFQGVFELFMGRGWAVVSVMSLGIVLYAAGRRAPAFQFAAGVLIAAPVASSALDALLPYGVPIRYGLSVGLLGFILIAWPRWSRFASACLVGAALVSWLFSLGAHPFV